MVLRGVLANFLVTPVLIYLVMLGLSLSPDVKIGIMLMAAAPKNRPLQRDGTSDRTVDSPADYRSVSFRYGPAVSAMRRRWYLW